MNSQDLGSKKPGRLPGRPRGAVARVIAETRALGVHHFAFVRSGLLGLDLGQSFARYLAWSDTTTDLRYVQNRHGALLKQITEAGRHFDAALPPDQKITHLVDLLRSGAAAKSVTVLPSLDEWLQAEGMDPDGWSEAELLAEYQAHFGLDNADAIEAAQATRDPVAERVRALNYLETVLSTAPCASDRLESWFARPVAKVLRNGGLLTLSDLVRFINAYGYAWHGRIAGFGKQRAAQVVAWLVMEEEHLQLRISARVHEPKSKHALRLSELLAPLVPGVGQSAALAPFGAGSRAAAELAHYQRVGAMGGGRTLGAGGTMGAGHGGQVGDFRSHMANTLGATNDLEAVGAWLSRYDEKPHTQRSYRKEAERFLLCAPRSSKNPCPASTPWTARNTASSCRPCQAAGLRSTR